MSSCQDKQKADYIFTDGKVYTVDDSMNVAEAFAVRNGRFLAVGSDAEITASYNADSVIDLNGKAVYPGFIDPHCHFWGYGTVLQQADLTGTKSEKEMLQRLKDFAAAHPNAEWIQGRGWDNTMWPEQQMPDNKLLDSLFSQKPVVLRRVDGHAVLANSRAIQRAEKNLPKETGLPRGIYLDQDAQIILDRVPELNEKQKQRALLDAQRDAFEVGLTSVHDAGMDWHWVERIKRMQKQNLLKMRIYGMLNPTQKNLNKMYDGPVETDFLHIRSLKLYADGALGSRGAKLIKPYSDNPETNGLLLIQPDSMLS
ncbi:MAG: amidohydrolase, partial [Bacteroidota bacterium]